MDPIIYHITTPEAYLKAEEQGEYQHESLDTEGFIHCSTYSQVPHTIQRHFNDTGGLIILVINTLKLRSKLKYENTSGGTELFPHIYGPINIEAISLTMDWDTEGWNA